MKYEKEFESIIRESKLFDVLIAIKGIKFPKCYLGASSLAQTVWNKKHGFDLLYGINDLDIIFFDDGDIAEELENKIESILYEQLEHMDLQLDVTNQATVHLWYEEIFGKAISAYKSIEDAVDNWPTT